MYKNETVLTDCRLSAHMIPCRSTQLIRWLVSGVLLSHVNFLYVSQNLVRTLDYPPFHEMCAACPQRATFVVINGWQSANRRASSGQCFRTVFPAAEISVTPVFLNILVVDPTKVVLETFNFNPFIAEYFGENLFYQPEFRWAITLIDKSQEALD